MHATGRQDEMDKRTYGLLISISVAAGQTKEVFGEEGIFGAVTFDPASRRVEPALINNGCEVRDKAHKAWTGRGVSSGPSMSDLMKKHQKEGLNDAPEFLHEATFFGGLNDQGGHTIVEGKVTDGLPDPAKADMVWSAADSVQTLTAFKNSNIFKLVPVEAQDKVTNVMTVLDAIANQEPPVLTALAGLDFYTDVISRLKFFLCEKSPAAGVGNPSQYVYGEAAIGIKVKFIEDKLEKSKAKNPLPSGPDLKLPKVFSYWATPPQRSMINAWEDEHLEVHGLEQAQKAEKRKLEQEKKAKAGTNKRAKAAVERDAAAEQEVDHWWG